MMQIVYANEQVTLNPPWRLLQAKMSATLSADSCVRVSKIEGEGMDMKIRIDVCDYDKALALAAFLNKKYEYYKNLALTVQVYAPNSLPVSANLPTTPEEAVQVLNRALSGYPSFVKTGVNKKGTAAFVEFKPVIVQFVSDDISDYYLNTNLPVSIAFRDLLSLNPLTKDSAKIYSTTSRIN
jgi:hypothetical protein